MGSCEWVLLVVISGGGFLFSFSFLFFFVFSDIRDVVVVWWWLSRRGKKIRGGGLGIRFSSGVCLRLCILGQAHARRQFCLSHGGFFFDWNDFSFRFLSGAFLFEN